MSEFNLVVRFVHVKGGKTHKIYVEEWNNGAERRFSMEECNLDDTDNETEVVESMNDNDACGHCVAPSA